MGSDNYSCITPSISYIIELLPTRRLSSEIAHGTTWEIGTFPPPSSNSAKNVRAGVASSCVDIKRMGWVVHLTVRAHLTVFQQLQRSPRFSQQSFQQRYGVSMMHQWAKLGVMITGCSYYAECEMLTYYCKRTKTTIFHIIFLLRVRLAV